jgi:hypothetical protein
VKEFFIFFGIQALAYFLITINTRAVALAKYLWTALSDMAISATGFLTVSLIASPHGYSALAGYCLGGAFGSVVAIRMTKWLYGE